MPDDSDHVLDSIDGAVDEWLAMSDDSMRWTPPEKARPKPQAGLPVPPLPQVLEDLIQEVGSRFGPPAQAVIEAFRPLGEGMAEAVSMFLDSPPVRQFLDPPDLPEDPEGLPGGFGPRAALQPPAGASGAPVVPGPPDADPEGEGSEAGPPLR